MPKAALWEICYIEEKYRGPMVYLAYYLFIGLVLVIIRSPIRELVTKEIRTTKLSCLVQSKVVQKLRTM